MSNATWVLATPPVASGGALPGAAGRVAGGRSGLEAQLFPRRPGSRFFRQKAARPNPGATGPMKGEREYRELEGMQRHRPVKAEKFQAVRDAARPANGFRVALAGVGSGPVTALRAPCAGVACGPGHQPGPRARPGGGPPARRGNPDCPPGRSGRASTRLPGSPPTGRGSEAIIARLQATRTRHR